MTFRSTRVLSAPHVPLCYVGMVGTVRFERTRREAAAFEAAAATSYATCPWCARRDSNADA